MDEAFKRKVKDFLAGTLDRKQTLEVLDQVKKSDDARRYLEEQASVLATARRAQGIATTSERHTCRPIDPVPDEDESDASATSSSDAGDWSALLESPRRRGLRRTILLGFVVMIFIAVSSQIFGDKNGPEQVDVETRALLEALDAGQPVASSPAGEINARPMAISGVIPPGNSRLKLTILGQEGVVFEREFEAREAATEFDDMSIGEGERKRSAVEVLVPFPSAEELALQSGARYFIVLELPNGNASTPLRFIFRKN